MGLLDKVRGGDSFQLSGTLIDSVGRPLEGALVLLLRGSRECGRAVCRGEGAFAVEVERARFKTPDQQAEPVQLQALDAESLPLGAAVRLPEPGWVYAEEELGPVRLADVDVGTLCQWQCVGLQLQREFAEVQHGLSTKPLVEWEAKTIETWVRQRVRPMVDISPAYQQWLDALTEGARAAQAGKVSEQATLSAEAMYAWICAGLIQRAEQLAPVDRHRLADVLDQARASGIVSARTTPLSRSLRAMQPSGPAPASAVPDVSIPQRPAQKSPQRHPQHTAPTSATSPEPDAMPIRRPTPRSGGHTPDDGAAQLPCLVQPLIRRGDRSWRVLNLQLAMEWLRKHQGLQFESSDDDKGSPAGAPNLEERWRQEQRDHLFGPATQALVARFQEQQRLTRPRPGSIDAATAECINAALTAVHPAIQHNRWFCGLVRNERGVPQPQRTVILWARDADPVHRTEYRCGTDEQGRFRFVNPQSEADAMLPGGQGMPVLTASVVGETAERPLAQQDYKPSRIERIQAMDLVVSSVITPLEPEWHAVATAVYALSRGLPQAATARGATGDTHLRLDANELDFVAQAAELPADVVKAWAVADRLKSEALTLLQEQANQADLDLLGRHGGPAFFALVRSNPAAARLADVLPGDGPTWRRAWEQARVMNRVPELDQHEFDALSAAMDHLRLLVAVQPAAAAQKAEPVARVRALPRFASVVPAAVAVAAQRLIEQAGGGLEPDHVRERLDRQFPQHGAANAALVRGLRLHQLAQGHSALMEKLARALPVSGDDDSLGALAKWPLKKWRAAAHDAGLEPSRAVELQHQVELEHPDVALAERLQGNLLGLAHPLGQQVKSLHDNQPQLMRQLLKGELPAWEPGASEAEQTLKGLGTSLRLGLSLELSGRLRSMGIQSPAHLLSADVGALSTRLKAGADGIEAAQALEHAAKRAQSYLEAAKDVAGAVVTLSQGRSLSIKGLGLEEPPWRQPPGLPPDMSALFGDLDECTCLPCESMLGQPAYLVDLLELLKLTKNDPLQALLQTPHEALKQRRPDILALPLDCENANTSVLHIELALAILEKARADTSDEAYEATLEAPTTTHPAILPFDVDWAESMAYLHHLQAEHGLDLDDLLNLTGQPDFVRAGATLGLPHRGRAAARPEWEALTVPEGALGTVPQVCPLFGLAANFPAGFKDPASGEDLSRGVAAVEACRVSVLLDRTGLDLGELEHVLATAYVGRVGIAGRDECKTSKMKLDLEATKVAPALARIFRMVRLARHVPGWTYGDLDAALQALGVESAFSEQMLCQLAALRRLAKRLHLGPSKLTQQPRGAAVEAIAAALQWRPSQLRLLADWSGLNLDEPDPWDWVALERALDLAQGVEDAGLTLEVLAMATMQRTSLERWLQPLPPQLPSPAKCQELLEGVRASLRTARRALHQGPARDRVARLLQPWLNATEISEVMSAIDNAGAEDEKADYQTRLPLAAPRVQRVLGLVTVARNDQPAALTQAQGTALLAVATAQQSVAWPRDARYASLAADVMPEATRAIQKVDLIQALVQRTGLSEAHVAWFAGTGLSLRPATAETAGTRLLAAAFLGDDQADPPAIAQDLLAWCARLLRLVQLKSALAAEVFDALAPSTDWAGLLSDGTAAHAPAQCRRFVAAAWLGRADRLGPDLLRRALDLATPQGNASTVEQLKAVAQAIGLRVEAEADAWTLCARLEMQDAQGLSNPVQLKRLHDLLTMCKRLGATADQVWNLARISTLGSAPCVTAARALVKQAAGLENDAWEQSELRIEIEGPWLRQRRDALVASLVMARPSRFEKEAAWRNGDDIYKTLLIDPMVQPCAKTTKVLEATLAVQLFCHRLLFGMEQNVYVPPRLRQQWPWMRNYRVWEANRKVFLFPENWLYSELRDDKSSSIELLTAELGKGELNAEAADRAYGRFLDDVVRMSYVRPLGMYEDVALAPDGRIAQVDGDPVRRVLYVVGRTVNPPYEYFWRQCLDFGATTAEWSPWWAIELDIQGDHVLPAVVRGRLCLVWPMITKSNVAADGEVSASDENHRFELRLSISSCDGRQWSKPETSRDAVQVPDTPFVNDREAIALRFLPNEDGVPDGVPTVTCFVLREAPGKSQNSPPAAGVYRTIDVPDNGTLRAKQTVIWECWLKVKAGSSHAYIKLSASMLTSGTWASLGLMGSVPDWGLGLREPRTEFLGDQERRRVAGEDRDSELLGWSLKGKKWRAWFTGRNGSTGASKLVYECLPVPIGQSVTDRIVAVIDEDSSTTYSAEELGVDTKSAAPSRAFARFRLSGGTELKSIGADSSFQLARAQDVKFWMNGFLEDNVTDRSEKSVALAGVEAFKPSAAGSSEQGAYFLLPAASTRGANEPKVWHFSEGSAEAYVDVTPLPPNPIGQPLLALPASFPEVTDFRDNWFAKQEFPQLGQQGLQYGAAQLPSNPDNVFLPPLKGKDDFDRRLPNSCYAWEVMYHAPLLIADHLSKRHQFEAAERWLRYVFDPTSPQPLKFKPFDKLASAQSVKALLEALAKSVQGGVDDDAVKSIRAAIERWRASPFMPFVVARGRPLAFLWRTLFAYLDNLIAWADKQFRMDTRESNNEALMLYLLARQILGKRPRRVGGKPRGGGKTYNDIEQHLDNLANFWIEAAARRAPAAPGGGRSQPGAGGGGMPASGSQGIGMLLFCMPFNDKIDQYWRVIEDRLFNLRHCRNIDGIEREQPFTDPPIDPELLARATAAGLDLGSVVAGLYAPPPHYRYATVAARAADLTSEARALASALLSALEKKDAEVMAQLRSTYEMSLQRRVTELRKLQIREAEANIKALRATRGSAEARYNQYQRLLGLSGSAPLEGQMAGAVAMLGQQSDGSASKRSGLGLITEENEQYLGLEAANVWSGVATATKLVGAGGHATAAIVAATPAPDRFVKIVEAVATVASQVSDAFSFVSQAWRTYADQQGMLAGHLRRRDEWAFQSNQTLKELQQIDKQILSNQIRIEITQKELDNHLEQVEQTKAMDEVLRGKFTNAALYEWMSRELAQLYDQTFRMALAMARQAERAFDRDLGPGALPATKRVRNDLWNSQRQGLLAAERLHHDLKAMDVAYMEQNTREFEQVKHVSLRRLDPLALLALITKKRCEFEIPEWLFDLETPGHYMRRIRSVSLTIPCVVGPYTGVHCKLTLLRSSIRIERLGTGYKRKPAGEDDPRFIDHIGASEAIVTSMANGDSGLLEPQAREDRYLPFEGRGVADSRWRLELPGQFPQFDHSTITDVILTIRYTARDGVFQEDGKPLDAKPYSITAGLPSAVLLSCRMDFAQEWAGRSRGLNVKPTEANLPYWMFKEQGGFKPKSVTAYKLTKDAKGAFAASKWQTRDWSDQPVQLGSLTRDAAEDVFLVLI